MKYDEKKNRDKSLIFLKHSEGDDPDSSMHLLKKHPLIVVSTPYFSLTSYDKINPLKGI
jgi:hypothetical protein